MKQKTTRNICFCIQYVALHFSGHSTLEKTRLTTFKGQRSIFSGKHRPEDTTQIASLTAAWLSFMLTESFLFQFFSPPLLSSIHQAASASFYLYFRLLLRDFFSHNPWLKSELVFLLSWWNFVGPYLPTCNSVNFTEILTFLTGSTSLLYPREESCCRFTISTHKWGTLLNYLPLCWNWSSIFHHTVSPPDPAGLSQLSQGTQLSKWNTALGHSWQLSSLVLWQCVYPAPEEFQFPVF